MFICYTNHMTQLEELVELVVTACDELFKLSTEPVLTRPDPQFGDYATNIALQLAKQLKKPPREVAEQLQKYLQDKKHSTIANVEVAGPGFLNITLSDRSLWGAAQTKPAQLYKGKKVLLEYSCPNAFKELHTGHLYNTIAGDTLARLVEAAGGKVFRANFGGDVGLHVAKCLWGIVDKFGGENPEKLAKVKEANQAEWLSAAYTVGAQAFEDDPKAATEIKIINKQVYDFHANDDHTSPLAKIYWECRDWSYSYFKEFYKDIDVAAFDKYYPESQVADRGLEIVRDHLGQVFAESQGAVVFKGEDSGTHTRVFITSEKLPTYEAKDLGLIFTEVKDSAYDKRVVITGNDQSEYMKVVFAALAEIDGDLAGKQTHLTNGTVRFGDGKKMSSRLGNVTRAVDVIEAVSKAVDAKSLELRRQIMLGAVKYFFLRPRLGGDISFDVSESVSLAGNSGPYLQYAHARARSILKKASTGPVEPSFDPAERNLVQKLSQYAEVVEQATTELNAHHICTYLYELAQTFNRFYEQSRVIGDKRQDVRLGLVKAYADTLQNGLDLLNIPAPEHL